MTPSTETHGSDQPGAQPIAEGTISVKMYDAGFGDCFLVRIPAPDGRARKILFDCGSIKLGSQSIEEVVAQVIADARDTPSGRARIDIVVATHRHRDHVSGFDDPAWAEVEVGEVWMPWTEKSGDTLACAIRERQNRLAALLLSRLETRLAASASAAERAAIASAQDLAMNATSNEAAMQTLCRGFAGNPVRRYFPEEGANTAFFTTPLLPGVTIYVAGPSRDPEIICELDPPAGKHYLKMAEAVGGPAAAQARPFGTDWGISPDEYASPHDLPWPEFAPEGQKEIEDAGLSMDDAVAAALDRALNGTSLVLVLQTRNSTLLFPGDAQWGTWRLALKNQELRQLLKSTNLYKVGHHGSHNATPREFVEEVLPGSSWAMVSVTPHGSWKEIPKRELLDALRLKPGNKTARSDEPEAAGALGFIVEGKKAIEAHVPF